MGNLMKNILKRIFGITEMERALEETRLQVEKVEQAKKQAEEAAELALKEAEEAKMTPKERATAKGEPWVSVLDTHVNKDNIRNGFFELDWNDLFIVQLKQAGYGFDGDPDEEIVDRWFRDIVRNMLADEGMDTSRGAGYINVIPINRNQSEVS
jgi:alkylation response protein AidB-like acyl-CoA dehydrogenase